MLLHIPSQSIPTQTRSYHRSHFLNITLILPVLRLRIGPYFMRFIWVLLVSFCFLFIAQQNMKNRHCMNIFSFLVIILFMNTSGLYNRFTAVANKFVICCCSVAKSCLIFCDHMDCSTPGFAVLHYLVESAQTHVH